MSVIVNLAKAAFVSTITEISDEDIIEHASSTLRDFNNRNAPYCHLLPQQQLTSALKIFDPTPAFSPGSVMNLAYRHKRKSTAYAKNMQLKAPSILKPGEYEYVRS